MTTFIKDLLIKSTILIINLKVIIGAIFHEINNERSLIKYNQVPLNLTSAMHDTTKKFLQFFFEYENKTISCQLEDYIDNVSEYSFKFDNFLGDYSGCISKTDEMTFLFFIFIHNDIDKNIQSFKEDHFSFYFKDLMFNKNYVFAMCVPKCLKFKNFERINPFNLDEDKNKTFTLKIYDSREIYSKYLGYDFRITLGIYITYFLFFGCSIFFVIVPTYETFRNCGTNLFCCKNKNEFRTSKLRMTDNFLNEDYSLEVTQIEDEKLKAILRSNRENNSDDNFNTANKNNRSIPFDCKNCDGNNEPDTTENNYFNKIYLKNNSDPDDSADHYEIDNSDDNLAQNNKKNKRDLGRNKIYKKISSIFSFSKNIKRVFKATNIENKTTSSYINDNSIAFLNGLKAINLILMTYCSIFWIFLEAPNSFVNYEIKENFMTNNFFILQVLYYLYWSIHLTFAYNGFSLGYKFLCHMNNKNFVYNNTVDKNKTHNNKNSYIKNYSHLNSFKNTIRKLFTFITPQFSKYPLYIFLFFVVYNIQYVLNFSKSKDPEQSQFTIGPLYFIYKEISYYTFQNFNYFLLLFANFKMGDKKFTKTSIYVFFFYFLNEVQYYFIILIILIIYHFKNNLGLFLLILGYIFSNLCRSVFSIFFNNDDIGTYGDARDFFGFETYNFHFLYGLPIYFIGAIFGVLYYEYNIVDDLEMNSNVLEDTFVTDESNLNYSQYLKKMDYTNRGRVFIKFLAKSLWTQNILILITVFILALFLLFDLVFLFPKLKENGFIIYKFNTWEKLYSFWEGDFLSVLIFLITFKFVIFNNYELKKLLESNLWIPLSRLYFVISCLLSPITYFFVLSVEYPITFSYSNVFFLSVSVLFIIYLISFFISLIIEVPLKVMVKKIVNYFIASGKINYTRKISNVEKPRKFEEEMEKYFFNNNNPNKSRTHIDDFKFK